MPHKRVTYTEYVVRISASKISQGDSILRSKEFSKPIHDGIRNAINAAAQKALRDYIRAGKLHRTFRVDTC
jgi:hypothetical protein